MNLKILFVIEYLPLHKLHVDKASIYRALDSFEKSSSNRETKNLGGYDIYSSSGYPNKWNKSNNLFDFNTTKDEMYFTFYDKVNGYFSSNRNSRL